MGRGRGAGEAQATKICTSSRLCFKGLKGFKDFKGLEGFKGGDATLPAKG